MAEKASEQTREEEETKLNSSDTTTVVLKRSGQDDEEDEDDDDKSTISVVEAVTLSPSSAEVASLTISQVSLEADSPQQQQQQDQGRTGTLGDSGAQQKSVSSSSTPNPNLNPCPSPKPTRQLVLTRSFMQQQQDVNNYKQQLNKHRHSFQSPHLLNRRYSHRGQRQSIFQASPGVRPNAADNKTSVTPPTISGASNAATGGSSRNHQQAVRSASTSLQPSSPLSQLTSTNFSASPLNSLCKSPISSGSVSLFGNSSSTSLNQQQQQQQISNNISGGNTTRQHQSFSARRLAGAHTLRLQLVATSWLAFKFNFIFVLHFTSCLSAAFLSLFLSAKNRNNSTHLPYFKYLTNTSTFHSINTPANQLNQPGWNKRLANKWLS